MAPDADIVTRVVAGRAAYFGTAWYAHRAASHSILGTLALGLVVAAVISGWMGARKRKTVPERPSARGPLVTAYAWLAGCAWAGPLAGVPSHRFPELSSNGMGCTGPSGPMPS